MTNEKQYAVYRRDNEKLVGVVRETTKAGAEIISSGVGIPVRYGLVTDEEASRLRAAQREELIAQ
ncbi:hypothetical protein HN832_03065 [archaeon]|jgi:hypothetical protein|nr:hypothetical protein [archaeon]MBT4531679.1 hypothetical protein [archaeon]MBT7282371.1 hypothetical protein [archaeon]